MKVLIFDYEKDPCLTGGVETGMFEFALDFGTRKTISATKNG